MRGMLLADATDTLAEAGFHQVEVYSADVLDHPGAVVIACQVAEQTPADGEAPPDQVISLGVYAAPETGHVCG
ncbi:hypothetical protein [Glycomyces paridis]|uniref:hypothetical protein n=1 Tax=Glycomyces paridis TaxID=2126555 RepID=UPI003B84B4C0